jgi:hypothetical protein
MTKAELIKALEKFPDDMEVVAYDHEYGGEVALDPRLSTEVWSLNASECYQNYLKTNPTEKDLRFPVRIVL